MSKRDRDTAFEGAPDKKQPRPDGASAPSSSSSAAAAAAAPPIQTSPLADAQNTTVSFYGSPGAFSEDAAVKFFVRSRFPNVTTTPSAGLDALFASVASGECGYAVVPFENSVSGTLEQVLVKLVTHPSLHIVGETIVAEEHCLAVRPGTAKEAIRTVLSHSHLLAQSSKFLSQLEADNGGHAIARQCTFDSAGACALVDGPTKAAIASRRAAEAHGLEVIASKFADIESETRYLVLSKQDVKSANRLGRRCTVSFVLPNQNSALFKALSCFAFRNLNILKVATVPLGGKGDVISSSSGGSTLGRWDYVFVVDFTASPNAEVNRQALSNLREYAIQVKVLGEYSPAESSVNSPSKRELMAFSYA